MNEAEFELIAAAIKSSYPNSKVLPDKYAMRIWYQNLMDLDYKVVENAVLEHIGVSFFPPSIAEIRQKCAERMSPMITDWGEAWEEVQKAIRRYGSYREIDAVKSLSKLTAVAVRRMGFQNLCKSENPVADRAHFQRIYEGMVKAERVKTQLPTFVIESKEKMIECNTKTAPQIEQKSVVTEGLTEKTSDPERVEKLLNTLRKSMFGGVPEKGSK